MFLKYILKQNLRKISDLLKEEAERGNKQPWNIVFQHSLYPKPPSFIFGMSHTQKVDSAQQDGSF